MTVTVPLRGGGPLYQQLYRGIRTAIRDGRLAPGTRLPSTRTLCDELGISRKVVLMAFRRLRDEGYVSARVGSGTFVTLSAVVRNGSPSRRSSGASARVRTSRYGRRLLAGSNLPTLAVQPPRRDILFDFRFGIPDPEPLFAGTWQRLLARHAKGRQLPYAPSAGSLTLRTAIAEYLAQARGIQTSAEHVVVLSGAQQGLDLVARLLLDPGDRVAIEQLHYRGARDVMLAAGARLTPLAIDAHGLRTDRLPPPSRKIRLLYATPSHQFPTGGVLPLGRRIELLRWAEDADAPILEDDYDAEFRYGEGPVEPLKALDDQNRVFYLNTFSKLLFPALRLAYLVVPEHMVGLFRAAKWLADRHTPVLEQEVLAEFIADGHLARHARRARLRYDARRRTLLAAIRRVFGDAVQIQGGRAGVHVVLWLPGFAAHLLPQLKHRAASAGIGIDTLESCAMRPLKASGLLLGYQGIPHERIDEGVERLASVING